MISDIFDSSDDFEAISTNTNLMNFSENRLYGYICKEKLYVPNNKFVKFSKIQSVLNFADTNEAFEALVATLTTHSKLGRIPPSSKFHSNNISIKRSYISVHDLYKQFMLITLIDFAAKINGEYFLDFQSFFKRFIYETYSGLHFMSDFIVSEAVSIFSTGLAIQMFDEKMDDLETATSYIKDKFFRIFKNICLQHNFIIDKHMPWVIVYRVSDPYLTTKLSRYINVYDSDMQIFLDTVKMLYTYYVNNILAKELKNSAEIYNFNLPRDSILSIYLRKKLERHSVAYSEEDFKQMLHFFKFNGIVNGVGDSAYKLDRIEQKFSPIYDDRQHVYLRPGNI